MRHTLVDRLLLGKTFTFQSDLSPAECAARLTAVPAPESKNILWKAQIEAYSDTDDGYPFELYLLRYEGLIRGAVSCHAEVKGIIKRRDAFSGSTISGIVQSSWAMLIATLFFGLICVFWLIPIVIGLLNLANEPDNLWTILVLLTQPVFGLFIIRSWWQDRRRIMQQLEQALQARYVYHKPKRSIQLGLTMADRLLLGRTFAFTSNRSMKEAASKIVELTDHGLGEDRWFGTVNPSNTVCTFDLSLSRAAFRNYGMVGSAFQTHIRGIIEEDAVPGTSSVVGVVVSGVMIWVYIGGAFLIFMLLLQQWWLPDGQQNLMAVCFYLWALLFSLSILGTVLNDRHYAVRILERSLLVSYRTGKAEQS
jgi:hypothetical protein